MNELLRPLSLRLRRHRWIDPVLRSFRTARGWTSQFVDLPLRQLQATAGQLRESGADILYLGNSTNLYVEPLGDGRRLTDLIDAELGSDLVTTGLAGPGYGAELHAEAVRLLGTLAQRPRAVVLSLAVRTSAVHVARHPAYGYRRSLDLLRTLDEPAGRLPSVTLRNRPTHADFERFHALAVTTRWRRGRTIGEFQAALRGSRAAAEDLERQRTLFDYLHGEVLGPEHPRLRHYAELGTRLRDYGVPVVAYWAPIPVDRGEACFPAEFIAHVEANLRVARKTFEDALGPLLRPVDTGWTPDEEFIDGRDGSEHWNLSGRLRMASLIAGQVKAVVEP